MSKQKKIKMKMTPLLVSLEDNKGVVGLNKQEFLGT
jgi:hypothetical protein